MAITEHVIPLFILIGLGYLARRTLLTAQPLTPLNQFVYYFAVPALIFDATYQQDMNNLINLPFLGAFLLAALLTALVAVTGSRWLFRCKEPEQLISTGLIRSMRITPIWVSRCSSGYWEIRPTGP